MASFIDVFDGVVTMARGAVADAAFTGDLLAVELLLLPLVGELMTNFSGGTTPSLFLSTTTGDTVTDCSGFVVVVVAGEGLLRLGDNIVVGCGDCAIGFCCCCGCSCGLLTTTTGGAAVTTGAAAGG